MYFETDQWSDVRPSQFGGFVRACGRHKEPRFPKIAAQPNAVFNQLYDHFLAYGFVTLDWQVLEDQL